VVAIGAYRVAWGTCGQSRLSSPAMNAAQVNTVGGTCELLGLVTVAWDLVDVARYRGIPARIRARLQALKAAIVAAWRTALHRPRNVTLAVAGTATAHAIANQAVELIREPFTPRPGQSLEDQIAELGQLVNRLQNALLAQDLKHGQAIDMLRQQTDEKLRAEQRRADDVVGAVRGELDRLREITTGGLYLEIDGVLGVLLGVIFTTWPQNVAARLSWLPFRVVIVGVFLYACLRALSAWVKHYDARAAAG
jgi:hypothetical protein